MVLHMVGGFAHGCSYCHVTGVVRIMFPGCASDVLGVVPGSMFCIAEGLTVTLSLTGRPAGQPVGQPEPLMEVASAT